MVRIAYAQFKVNDATGNKKQWNLVISDVVIVTQKFDVL